MNDKQTYETPQLVVALRDALVLTYVGYDSADNSVGLDTAALTGTDSGEA